MKKINYKLTTLSSVIVSPRDSLAWYKDLEDFTDAQISEQCYLDKKELKVIYPFYQYGEYITKPSEPQYYLPGSSIKGALGIDYSKGQHCLVDDLLIPKENIVLRNLYKAQYLNDPPKAIWGAFMNNVGVEMLKKDVELQGEFYAQEIDTILLDANSKTKNKMNQMLEYVGMLKDSAMNEELSAMLTNAARELRLLIKEPDIILLGGYKGLMHSMEIKSDEDYQGAIFLDPESGRPHGLVRIQICEMN